MIKPNNPDGWSWADVTAQFPDQDSDDGNQKTLGHLYRWGVVYGAINPNSDAAKKQWADIDD